MLELVVIPIIRVEGSHSCLVSVCQLDGGLIKWLQQAQATHITLLCKMQMAANGGSGVTKVYALYICGLAMLTWLVCLSPTQQSLVCPHR